MERCVIRAQQENQGAAAMCKNHRNECFHALCYAQAALVHTWTMFQLLTLSLALTSQICSLWQRINHDKHMPTR